MVGKMKTQYQTREENMTQILEAEPMLAVIVMEVTLAVENALLPWILPVCGEGSLCTGFH